MKPLLYSILLLGLLGCETQTTFEQTQPRLAPVPLPSDEPSPEPSEEPSPEPSPSPSPSVSPSPEPDLTQFPYNLDGLYLYRETKCGSTTTISVHTEPSLAYNYREVSGSEMRLKQPVTTDSSVSCGVKVVRVGTFTKTSNSLEETVQYNLSHAASCTPTTQYVSGQVENWTYETTATELIFVGLTNCNANGDKLKMYYDRVE